MEETTIKIENISKKYTLGKEVEGNLRGFLGNLLKTTNSGKKNDFWALEDISFDVKKGEVIGIIGKNGAGKSTLLKILSRITKPTQGRIEIKGRVASLLEVGTGFHPELTGKENIYLNGTILGMSRKEVKEKFDEIVEFSGVSEFLNTPVKHYSSGMYVRLAFSVAAHLPCEILIIDEVLAVGDLDFQKKCLGKMSSIAKTGKTVLFVSHQMTSVSHLCDKAIVLSNGKLDFMGDTSKAIDRYIDISEKKMINEYDSEIDRSGKGDIQFTKSYMEDDQGNVIGSSLMRQPFNLVMEYKSSKVLNGRSELAVKLGIFEMNGHRLSLLWNQGIGEAWKMFPDEGVIKCSFVDLPLNAGTYYYNISIHYDDELEDWLVSAGHIVIEPSDVFNSGKTIPSSEKSSIIIDQKWTIE